MPPITSLRATYAIEMTKVAGLGLIPAGAALYGFAWFAQAVRDPLWILLALFAMAVIAGISVYLISEHLDRKMADDIAIQAGRSGADRRDSLPAR